MSKPKFSGFITHNTKIFQQFDTDLFRGFYEVDVPKGEPIIRWKGPRCSILAWQQLLSWFRAHPEHEVQARFVIDAARENLGIVVHKQIYGTGMTTKEMDDPDMREKLTQGGWDDIGTIHTHCNMSAFQSSVDHRDEVTQQGLHITVGKLKEETMDIHSRGVICIPGVMDSSQKLVQKAVSTMGDVCLIDWFDMPEWFPQELESDVGLQMLILKHVLTAVPPKSVEYPKEWDTKLEKPVTNTYSYKGTTPPVYGGVQQYGRYSSRPSDYSFTKFREYWADIFDICQKHGFQEIGEYEDVRTYSTFGEFAFKEEENKEYISRLGETSKEIGAYFQKATVNIVEKLFWECWDIEWAKYATRVVDAKTNKYIHHRAQRERISETSAVEKKDDTSSTALTVVGKDGDGKGDNGANSLVWYDGKYRSQQEVDLLKEMEDEQQANFGMGI